MILLRNEERVLFFKDGTWCYVHSAISGPFKKKPWWKIL